MKIAVVGATGLVGQKMLKVLEERQFPVTELLPVASERSIGNELSWKGKRFTIISADEAITAKPAVAIFSAGSGPSRELAPRFAGGGTFVIDNSSQWRMDPKVPLVVPEINPNAITADTKIIANPNCSTIQMVMVLKPVHQINPIKKVVVSTYQSVSGTGSKGLKQLEEERNGNTSHIAYPYQINMNAIPQVDVFTDSGFTKEELKMINETRKIMNAPSMKINATCVRVPVRVGHSESVYVECENEISLDSIREALTGFAGVKLYDDVSKLSYPMAIDCEERDEVFVGRIRKDLDNPNAFSCWIVSDNLRKGAATNAVQIAQYLLEKKMIG